MTLTATTSRIVSLATLGFLSAFTAGASTISIANFSFEDLPPVTGLPTSCGLGCSFSSGAIPGWTGSDATSGQFQPGTQAGNLASFSTLSDSITIAYSNGATLSQAVSTLGLGTYTLMVDLGQRNDTAFTAGADLLINGSTVMLATGTAPSAGNWSTFTASFTGAPSTITIQLTSGGVQADFDNVRLSFASAVPEPAGFTLLGLGLAGLLVVARRKRTN